MKSLLEIEGVKNLHDETIVILQNTFQYTWVVSPWGGKHRSLVYEVGREVEFYRQNLTSRIALFSDAEHVEVLTREKYKVFDQIDSEYLSLCLFEKPSSQMEVVAEEMEWAEKGNLDYDYTARWKEFFLNVAKFKCIEMLIWNYSENTHSPTLGDFITPPLGKTIDDIKEIFKTFAEGQPGPTWARLLVAMEDLGYIRAIKSVVLKDFHRVLQSEFKYNRAYQNLDAQYKEHRTLINDNKGITIMPYREILEDHEKLKESIVMALSEK